jgi:THO complex subunit 3
VATIEAKDGYVDVLINNAGMIGPNQRDLYEQNTIESLRDTMLRDWDGWAPTMATNASSVIAVSAAFLPLLDAANRRRGWEGGKVTGTNRARKRDKPEEGVVVDEDDQRLAQIITIASISAFMRKVSAGLAYNASKAAAVHLAKILATTLAEWGIRSNVVAPGRKSRVLTFPETVQMLTERSVQHTPAT